MVEVGSHLQFKEDLTYLSVEGDQFVEILEDGVSLSLGNSTILLSYKFQIPFDIISVFQ